MWDAKRFLTDHNIKFYESGKNVSVGWIGISCPLCGDKSSHGGFNISKGYYKCWRCGSHYIPKIVAKLLNISIPSAQQIFKKYLSTDSIQHEDNRKQAKEIIFPTDTRPLTLKAKQYLIARKFDPDKLSSIYGLLSTSHIGTYKNRILAPIYFNKKIVSYQTRDITNVHPVRYLPCPQEEEVLPYKNVLYGIDNCKSDKAIIVEGITDVWRLGPGSVCCFGTQFTKPQIILIAQRFKTIFVFFDNEPLAQLQADKLCRELNKHLVVTENIQIDFEGDPADLSQDDADNLIKEIGL
jgi:DNA primase